MIKGGFTYSARVQIDTEFLFIFNRLKKEGGSQFDCFLRMLPHYTLFFIDKAALDFDIVSSNMYIA